MEITFNFPWKIVGTRVFVVSFYSVSWSVCAHESKRLWERETKAQSFQLNRRSEWLLVISCRGTLTFLCSSTWFISRNSNALRQICINTLGEPQWNDDFEVSSFRPAKCCCCCDSWCLFEFWWMDSNAQNVRPVQNIFGHLLSDQSIILELINKVNYGHVKLDGSHFCCFWCCCCKNNQMPYNNFACKVGCVQVNCCHTTKCDQMTWLHTVYWFACDYWFRSTNEYVLNFK